MFENGASVQRTDAALASNSVRTYDGPALEAAKVI